MPKSPVADAVIGWLSFLVFGGVLVVAAVSDARTRRISNVLPLLLLAGFVLVAAIVRPSGIGSHLASGALVTALVLALYVLRAMGGGDVKLLAAVALWFSLDGLALFIALLGLVGGLQAAAVLLRRRFAVVEGPYDRRMPYAPAIAAAAVAAAILAPAAFLGSAH